MPDDDISAVAESCKCARGLKEGIMSLCWCCNNAGFISLGLYQVCQRATVYSDPHVPQRVPYHTQARVRHVCQRVTARHVSHAMPCV